MAAGCLDFIRASYIICWQQVRKMVKLYINFIIYMRILTREPICRSYFRLFVGAVAGKPYLGVQWTIWFLFLRPSLMRQDSARWSSWKTGNFACAILLPLSIWSSQRSLFILKFWKTLVWSGTEDKGSGFTIVSMIQICSKDFWSTLSWKKSHLNRSVKTRDDWVNSERLKKGFAALRN